MAYRLPNSRKSNFATEPPGMPAEVWTRVRLPGLRRAGESMVWMRLHPAQARAEGTTHTRGK
jgi:hypothetical protein